MSAPDNYAAKIEKIRTIQDYLAGLCNVSGVRKVSKMYDDLEKDGIDTPLVCVLYVSGDSFAVREQANATLHFDIILKDKVENELNDLDIVKLIAAQFEEYTLGGRCIGMTPGFPTVYYDGAGEAKGINWVIRLDIEV